MKKWKNLLRGALALLLTAASLAGPLALPASHVRADGAEFGTDGTAFTEPEYDTAMMYFWHKGLPSVTKDKQGNYIKYPILITWKDTYCLRTDENFKNELLETHSKQKKKNDHYKFFGIGIGYVASDSYSADDYDRVWGDTDYYMRYLYDTTDSSLLSKLGLDMNSLKKYGEAVSMDASGLPFIVPTDLSKDQYAIGLDEKVFGTDYWLVGSTRTWEWVEESGLIIKSDSWMGGDVQWELDYEYWDSKQFLDKNYVYKKTRSMYDVDKHQSYEYKEGADQHYWTVKQDANGLYHFWTQGENEIASWGRITGSYGKGWNRDRMRDWYHANDVGRVNLYYKGAKIGASTPTVKNKDWKTRVNTVDNTDGYTVYYADPNIVSFYRNSFTVEKGQVVNLDGPLVLDNSCTVTVKDGGVLSCSGWVVNNGQINVEPGGMLILQERTTATGDSQYGCISSVNAAAGTGSGRIACDGTIIINRDCKLTCAGCYGLQLGAKAQVVNYGQIIAENLTVNSDHIIENRGDASAVFAGWGVTDSGYALSRTQITGQDYNAKGTREKACAVSIVRDAVYGDGASRFYVNSAAAYTVIEKVYKHVSGYVAQIDGTSGQVQPELPAGIPIYYDEDYGVAFIKVGGKIYQYDGLVGRWVNVEEGNHESFYDYRMPSKADETIADKLPDGFILTDGRIVGQKVNEDVYYDWHVRVYWLYSGVNYYYYEPALRKYIHVLSDSTYCVCPDELAPPPNYDSDHVPSSMYSELPSGAKLYSSGMTEVENPFGKPEVTVENGLFCVEVEGTKLWWMEKYRKFLPKEYTVVYGEPQGGLTETQVNWGYFDPDTDPDAKPKVQKGKYETGNVYYYIVYHGNTYVWYTDYQQFFYGTPDRSFAPPIPASEVDLNGYTLP